MSDDRAFDARTLRIRDLNDRLRRDMDDGAWVLSIGVGLLGNDVVLRALSALKTFDQFTTDNDPHGEHDFGTFPIDQHRFMWKIDYYDLDRQYASPDPADKAVTARVLTLMLADEY